MALARMDNVLIVVEDLEAVKAFWGEARIQVAVNTLKGHPPRVPITILLARHPQATKRPSAPVCSSESRSW